MANKSNGFVLWEGASLIDDSPIVAIVTGLNTASTNSKTGEMLQSYILLKDSHPITALLDESDTAICGDCPLKRQICYVDLRGVGQVWKRYRDGGYPPLNSNILNLIKVQEDYLRIGTYGDSAATPIKAWENLLENVSGHTGYTHQWRDCDLGWRELLMASVETIPQKEIANSNDWRTFRIIAEDETPLPDEILCNNFLDRRIKCISCLLCNGDRGKNIADPVHGLKMKKNNYYKMFGENGKQGYGLA